MYRVTRKQMIRQKGEQWEGSCDCSASQVSVIEFEDFQDRNNEADALVVQQVFLAGEIAVGYQWYSPNKVIFETPSFYRSVTVTIEEVK